MGTKLCTGALSTTDWLMVKIGIFRNQFWGTSLSLWVSKDYEEIVCAGSIIVLEQLTGEKVTDLHEISFISLTIYDSIKKGKGVLRRVPEVFDSCFKSG